MEGLPLVILLFQVVVVVQAGALELSVEDQAL